MKKEFSYVKKNEQWFPLIDITIRGPKHERPFRALVDSGASFSVFRADVANFLGVPIRQGKELYLAGIGGRILGYLHEVEISVDGRKFFKCKIVFSQEFAVSFNLLGRDNFFEPFVISFLEKERKIVLRDA